MTKVVILGTAHLSTTPGKCSPDGNFREAEFSRQLVSSIKVKLESLGLIVFIDHAELVPTADLLKSSGSTQQQKELNYRCKRVNEICNMYGTANCIYVSIHVDGAGDGTKWMTAGGWSAYTTKGKTNADFLATCLYAAARNNLAEYEKYMDAGKVIGKYGKNQVPYRTDTTDGDDDLESDFYVLKHTKCPSVLTENLYQDNESDVDFLTSQLGRHSLERLHVEGILAYFNQIKK